MQKGTARTRIGRYSERNRVYHVTTRTHDRQPVFSNLDCGRKVVQALQCEKRRGAASTLAFVVMPDHLHWLVRLDTDRSLSDSVCIVKSNSAREINAMLGRKDRIWQRGFYDRAVRCEDDLVAIARYIIANPMRAGLVRSAGQYALWDAIWVR